MDKRWIQDIMNQRFLPGTFMDPTRLILATYIVKEASSNIIPRRDVATYIYRAYADNSDMAKRNPSIFVRNIQNYGLSEMFAMLDDALKDWLNDAQNGMLSFDDNRIYVDIELEDKELCSASLKVIEMLYKKYFKTTSVEPQILSEIDVDDDNNMEYFGKGIFKRRVLEDIQYCPLCEETRQGNLYAIHILPNKYSSLSDRLDKNNGIIFCGEHAKAYLAGEFAFSPDGFISVKKPSDIVSERMHLSYKVKSKERMQYIAHYFAIFNETSPE